MKSRVLVLGAGFGGMELSTLLSEALGEKADVTVIEKSDSFVFGYSKIDVMFGLATTEAVRLPYRNFVKPGVRFVQETITAIDPVARRVTTTGGTYEGDFLVVALGAEYDLAATPGLAEGRVLCRERGPLRGEFDPRQAQRRRCDTQRGNGQLLCRVRRWPHRLGGPGLPDRAETHEHLPRALGRTAGRQGAVRCQPQGRLVWALTTAFQYEAR